MVLSVTILDIFFDPQFLGRSDFAAGYIMIHETFHASSASKPEFSHPEMANAAYNVAKARGLLKEMSKTNYPGPPRPGTGKEHDWYNGKLFDIAVQLGCPRPK